MLLNAFIARRYLFSKKSHNAINIITAIAVMGIGVATAAMICVMSVFNGFRDLVSSLYTTFDPELVVVPTKGKFAPVDDPLLTAVRHNPAVSRASATLSDNALILFRGHPLIVTVKGVDSSFADVVQLPHILHGLDKHPFVLQAAGVHYGILGKGLAEQIGTLDFDKLQICAPRGGERINLANPIESFSTGDLYAGGLSFAVGQHKYDDTYILTSLNFTQTLFEKEGRLSRLELRLRPGADIERVKSELRRTVGEKYQVLDRMEQQADVFNVMKVEKFFAYLFLTFIILLATFNVVSSLSMVILEKRDDVRTLRHLGMSTSRVRSIFVTEGNFIALIGTLSGVGLGVLLVLLQQQFGLIRMGDGSNFITPTYPVSLRLSDTLIIFGTSLGVGCLSVWYTVRTLSSRFLQG